MLVLNDVESIRRISDPELRGLLETRLEALGEVLDDFHLEDLVRFVIVQPGDTLQAIDQELGFPILTNRFDGTPFGAAGFIRSWDVLEERGNWFDLVFVLSDDGYGVEVLVPKAQGTPPELLEMCVSYASQTKAADA